MFASRVISGRWAIALWAAAVLAAGMAAAPSRAQEAPLAADATQPRRVVVRFLTEAEFPPFNYFDDDGVLTGFNVDLARAICLELAAACDIKVKPWDDLFAGLKRSEADAVIASHLVTAQALNDVEFTDRYFYTPGRFAARTETAKSDISPEGLDGRSIGVAKGSPHEAFIKAFFRDSKIMPFESPELARDALQLGKVDFIFDDSISLAFWLNGSISRKCCEFRGGAYFEPKYFGNGIAIAVTKNDPEIKSLINTALERVRLNGRFQEIVDRYFPLRAY